MANTTSDQRVSLRRSSMREVEQGGQHQRRQLDRDGVDPVERLAFRQRIEQLRGALADHRLDVAEVARGRDAADRLALLGVLRRVHGDERGELRWLLGISAIFCGREPEGDAVGRRVGLPVAVDGPNVVVARDRPVPPGAVELVEVDRVLGPQSGEVVLPAVFLEEVGVQWVDVLDGQGRGLRRPLALLGHLHLRGDDVRVEDLSCLFGHLGHDEAHSLVCLTP